MSLCFLSSCLFIFLVVVVIISANTDSAQPSLSRLCGRTPLRLLLLELPPRFPSSAINPPFENRVITCWPNPQPPQPQPHPHPDFPFSWPRHRHAARLNGDKDAETNLYVVSVCGYVSFSKGGQVFFFFLLFFPVFLPLVLGKIRGCREMNNPSTLTCFKLVLWEVGGLHAYSRFWCSN